MEVVSAILNVALKIAKAAETARKNKTRCLDLADRARTIGDILREDRDSGASMITRSALERLKAALDDALELVESQRLARGIERGVAFFTSDKVADRFQLLQTRISDCVHDLNYAKLVAAGHRAHDGNTRAAPLWPSQLLKPSPLRPSQLLKPSPLRPSQLLQPSPLKPSQLLQPSPLKPSLLKPPQPAERGEVV